MPILRCACPFQYSYIHFRVLLFFSLFLRRFCSSLPLFFMGRGSSCLYIHVSLFQFLFITFRFHCVLLEKFVFRCVPLFLFLPCLLHFGFLLVSRFFRIRFMYPFEPLFSTVSFRGHAVHVHTLFFFILCPPCVLICVSLMFPSSQQRNPRVRSSRIIRKCHGLNCVFFSTSCVPKSSNVLKVLLYPAKSLTVPGSLRLSPYS